VLKPLHDLCNGLQKVCDILTVCHVSRVAPRKYPAVDKGKLGPKHPMLSELSKALGQAQEQLKLMGKNGRILGKGTAPLQLVLKFAECPAALHLHEFSFEEAFNSVSGHIHRTAPSPSVQEGAGIVQTMGARPGLCTDTSV
jgi:hypothetical protein